MKLYLQLGARMMGLTRELLARWNGEGGVILSPRDLEPTQLAKLAEDVGATGAEVLVDPQCYVREADHKRLTQHDYWAALQNRTTSGLLAGGGAGELLDEVESMNAVAEANRRIVPGLLATEVDDHWFAFQDELISEAKGRLSGPLLATIAVGREPMRSEAKIEAIVEHAERWDVDGFYVVADTPGPYLVDDPIWLANLLILASGLKLLGHSVLVGYANHQGLSLAAANVDAIASGTWLNVRAFGADKFFKRDEDSKSRRAKWYYCPQALSEYKMQFVDVAFKTGHLSMMRPEPPAPDHYAAPLFSGAQPTNVDWSETDSFRHYLDCLRAQVREAKKDTFDATIADHRSVLSTAETVLKRLGQASIRGQDRDFGELVDVSRAALSLHEAARGPMLRRRW